MSIPEESVGGSSPVRRAVWSDAQPLGVFADACFREAFGGLFAADGLDRLCSRAFGINEMEALIRSGTWIADGVTGFRGYICLGEISCPQQTFAAPIVELARLYVCQQWQGKGVADQLMRTFLTEVRGRGAVRVWLQAYEGNPRARAFYRRWGFVDLGMVDIVREGKNLPHVVMGLELDR